MPFFCIPQKKNGHLMQSVVGLSCLKTLFHEMQLLPNWTAVTFQDANCCLLYTGTVTSRHTWLVLVQPRDMSKCKIPWLIMWFYVVWKWGKICTKVSKNNSPVTNTSFFLKKIFLINWYGMFDTSPNLYIEALTPNIFRNGPLWT